MQRPVSKGQDSRSPSPPSTSLPVPVRSTSDAKDHSPVDECKGEEASDITMELELGPPSRVVAGLQLSSPIVVVLKSPKAKAAASDSGTQGQNLGGIWAYLSLMSADGRTSLSPPRTDLLLGQPVASVHKYPESSMVDNTAFAYAKFPGLSITAPGSYRLRINIIDMHSAHTEAAAKLLLPSLNSDPFDVVEVEGAEAGTEADGGNPLKPQYLD